MFLDVSSVTRRFFAFFFARVGGMGREYFQSPGGVRRGHRVPCPGTCRLPKDSPPRDTFGFGSCKGTSFGPPGVATSF